MTYQHTPPDKVRDVIMRNFARTALGSSTWRAIRWDKDYQGEDKGKAIHLDITDHIVRNLDIPWFERLVHTKNFDAMLTVIADSATKLAEATPLAGRQLQSSEMFGYAAKGIALYMRSVILHRDLLSDSLAHHLRMLCPSALDSYVFKYAKNLDIEVPKTFIKQYTPVTWKKLQKNIETYCRPVGWHPLDFDYMAWTTLAAPTK